MYIPKEMSPSISMVSLKLESMPSGHSSMAQTPSPAATLIWYQSASSYPAHIMPWNTPFPSASTNPVTSIGVSSGEYAPSVASSPFPVKTPSPGALPSSWKKHGGGAPGSVWYSKMYPEDGPL